MALSAIPAFLTALALSASGPFEVWDFELLTGEWGELYDDGSSAPSFQYFRFDPDQGAVWIQSHEGRDALHFEFPASGITEDNGLVILTTYPQDDFMVRFVVSGFRISEYKDTGLATGYLYMFQKLEDGWMLFNSFPFTGRPLEPDDPIFSNEQLRPFLQR